jgi:hypothetical protein
VAINVYQGPVRVILLGPDGVRAALAASEMLLRHPTPRGYGTDMYVEDVERRCELRLLSWEPSVLEGPSPLPSLLTAKRRERELEAEVARLTAANEELSTLVARSLADNAEVVRLGADQERARMREAAARQRKEWLERLNRSPGSLSLRCYLECLDDLELTLLTGWTR